VQNAKFNNKQYNANDVLIVNNIKKSDHLFKSKFILIILSLLCLNVTGQNIKTAKNTIYYEIGGTGFGFFSINYDRLFNLSETINFTTGFGFSITNNINVGGTESIGNNQFFIPLQGNFLFGKQRNKFEFGFGMPLAIDSEKFGIVTPIYVLRIGYRFQPAKNGLMFRASLNPSIIAIAPCIIGALAVGYIF
jgi:hypothetical protein